MKRMLLILFIIMISSVSVLAFQYNSSVPIIIKTFNDSCSVTDSQGNSLIFNCNTSLEYPLSLPVTVACPDYEECPDVRCDCPDIGSQTLTCPKCPEIPDISLPEMTCSPSNTFSCPDCPDVPECPDCPECPDLTCPEPKVDKLPWILSIIFGGLFIAMLVAFLLKTHYESGEEEEMPVSPPSFNIPETQENSFEEFKS